MYEELEGTPLCAAVRCRRCSVIGRASAGDALGLEPFAAVCQADAQVKPRRTLFTLSIHLRRGLPYALSAAAAAALSVSGCATDVNTFSPDDEPNTAGTGSPGQGGSKATGGGSSATAGTGTQAFGGTTAMGGKGGTSSAGAGGNAAGGNAGMGGTAMAGSSGGGSGGAQGGGTGGSAAGSGGSGGSGVATGCLKDWKDNETCDTCSTQTQGDKLACVDILDCYAVNDCGPSTCANNDDKCGVNKIQKGTAGYEIAAEVHACICK
jgi:hypothetical protein